MIIISGVRKYSRKREAILRAIRSTKSHPSADWVYTTLRPDFPDLSLGTVYRNIAEFKNDGVIRSVGFVEGQERFDGDVSEHSHFVCTACGSVLDVDAPCAPPLDELRQSTGLDIQRRETAFYGLCSNCVAHG